MSEMLLDERLVCIQPSLVRRLGIAEAAIVQQLHYWLRRATNSHDGHIWVYKTYSEWSDEIGLSSKAVRGALDKLRRADVVVAIQSPLDTRDRTLWWRIDYTVLHDEQGSPSAPEGRPTAARGMPSAREGSSHARVPDVVHRAQTEMTAESGVQTPKAYSFNGRRVKADDAEKACEALAAFNELAGASLKPFVASGASPELKRVTGAILDHPELSRDDWHQMVAWTIANPWWKDGVVTIGAVFGPNAVGENIDKWRRRVVRQPANGSGLGASSLVDDGVVGGHADWGMRECDLNPKLIERGTDDENV